MTGSDGNDIIYLPYKEGAKIWHYFLRATGDMEGKFAKCIFETAEGVCNSILSMGKNKSTNGMTNHLRLVHKIAKRNNQNEDEEDQAQPPA